MGMKEFELLLENIDRMTGAIEKVPEQCREIVYSKLVDALLKDDYSSVMVSQLPHIHSSAPLLSVDADDRNIAEELEDYYSRYSLASASDMEYAAFLGFYFSKLAPPGEMTDRIDESHYKIACMITGRKLPSRISGTLNNAKNMKGYLESHGGGIYSITAMGEHYVKHRLLKEEDK